MQAPGHSGRLVGGQKDGQLGGQARIVWPPLGKLRRHLLAIGRRISGGQRLLVQTGGHEARVLSR